MIQTNWYIITGGPSTGKSKTIDHLAFLGCNIRPEAARILIDNEMSKGKTLQEIRGNETKFEENILNIKTLSEEKTNVDEIIFWERGMQDSIVYLKRCLCDFSKATLESKKRKYKGVFLLDILPKYEKDYARTEDREEAKNIHEALFKIYLDYGYDVIRVPVMCISDRANFILDKIGYKSSSQYIINHH